tara:strand:- start:463 stop:858 length:396 start_codon:yes stop_codon:yes gene_type:complete
MGKTQITINQSFYKKMDEIENRVKHEVYSKGEEIVSYAAAISPVKTGAYVESFSVVSKGAGGGRSYSSKNRPDFLGDKDALKQEEAARLRSEIRSIDPLESEGFTLRNRSPHSKDVENKHNVFLRTKDRFR